MIELLETRYGVVIFTVEEERNGIEKCGFIDPEFFFE